MPLEDSCAALCQLHCKINDTGACTTCVPAAGIVSSGLRVHIHELASTATAHSSCITLVIMGAGSASSLPPARIQLDGTQAQSEPSALKLMVQLWVTVSVTYVACTAQFLKGSHGSLFEIAWSRAQCLHAQLVQVTLKGTLQSLHCKSCLIL